MLTCGALEAVVSRRACSPCRGKHPSNRTLLSGREATRCFVMAGHDLRSIQSLFNHLFKQIHDHMMDPSTVHVCIPVVPFMPFSPLVPLYPCTRPGYKHRTAPCIDSIKLRSIFRVGSGQLPTGVKALTTPTRPLMTAVVSFLYSSSSASSL